MKLTVLSTQPHVRGRVYNVTAEGKTLKVLLTFHALDRMAKWRLTDEAVLQALSWTLKRSFAAIMTGFIAHRRAKGHVMRVIYEYDGALPVAITVYNPVAERYFKGGENYEDRILA